MPKFVLMAIASGLTSVALLGAAHAASNPIQTSMDVAQAQARLADLRGRSDPFPALDLHKVQKALADLQAGGIDEQL